MRPPGSRQFSPNAMGTHQDWGKVMRAPHMQRMLRDPAIMQALYQNWRATGGQMPGMQGMAGQAPMQGMGGMAPSQGTPGQPPIPMQEGGGVPTAEEVNRLQQIRSGDVDPATEDELQDVARDVRPARFDQGGSVSDADLTQAYDDWQKAQRSQDPAAAEAARKKYMNLSQKRSEEVSAAGQPQQATNVGGAQISGQTMSGLKKLSTSGPPTLGNMAANIGLGALMGGASGGGSGIGALIGAGTAGALNYFLRRQAQQKKKQQEQGGDNSGGYSGTSEPQGGASQPGSYSGSGSASPGAPAPNPGVGASQLPPGPGLWRGTANVKGGDVVSSDGKTWKNAATGEPVDAGQVANATEEKSYDQSQAPSSSPVPFTPSASPSMNPTVHPAFGLGALDPSLQTTGPQGLKEVETFDPYAAALTEGDSAGLAHGGPVPHKHGIAIPVLHIAIMAKPKDKPPLKRAMGGEIPQAERRPRKPAAVPPTGGPNPYGLQSGARQPHGRVQVPKGSGVAIRGKRFGGIY